MRSILSQLATDVPAAEALVDELENRRRSLLVTGDDGELDAIDAKIVEANRNVERLCAGRDKMTGRLAEIEAAADQAQKIKAYRDAAAMVANMGPEVEKLIRDGCDMVIDGLRKVHLVEQAINQANANLPDNEAHLPSFELTMRGIPGEPQQRGKSKIRDHEWHYTGNAEGWGAVEAQFVGNVTPIGDGKTGKLNRSGSTFDVELRRYREVEVLIERGWARPVPLALSLRLPAFRVGEADIWAPFNPGFGDLGSNPAAILDHIDRLKQERLRPAMDPRPDRSTKTVLELVS
ncbi:hypothetical protein FJ970_22600 [Mesorhizobium sp. B2-1-8]|uniref:hypothetical protein n=1 Tax=Mesorhizobium sp. B2-1-8 TaxID=2589967 RepID=UPI00112D876A|nr:hypothetical protein [Mesorhizobium sp. B2-1-8]UCI17873.1 hypothetical protein FJ970_22600 [Mesorhizobium sp. B2-1-8]